MVKSFYRYYYFNFSTRCHNVIRYQSRREVNDDNMVFKNISAEFLEDTVILVSTVQLHDNSFDSLEFGKKFAFNIFHEYYNNFIYIFYLCKNMNYKNQCFIFIT